MSRYGCVKMSSTRQRFWITANKMLNRKFSSREWSGVDICFAMVVFRRWERFRGDAAALLNRAVYHHPSPLGSVGRANGQSITPNYWQAPHDGAPKDITRERQGNRRDAKVPCSGSLLEAAAPPHLPATGDQGRVDSAW